MRLKEFFETVWGVELTLITTATNGLEPRTDKVIAVCIGKTRSLTTYNDTHGEDLLKAQKYHMISDEIMYTEGLAADAFKQSVQDQIEGKVLLTYNVPFQHAFLSALLENPSLRLYDLSVIDQALRKGLQFDLEEIATFEGFYASCSARYFPMKVSSICKQLKASKEPSPGQYPLERMWELLSCVFREVSCQEVQQLPS